MSQTKPNSREEIEKQVLTSLYRLRPRRFDYGETPKQRVQAVESKSDEIMQLFDQHLTNQLEKAEENAIARVIVYSN